MNRGSGRYPIYPLGPALFKDSLGSFSLPRPSPVIPLEDLFRVPTFRVPVVMSRRGVIRDPLDEGMKGLDIRDVLPAQACEAGPELFVESHSVRRQTVAELPSEAASAHVPIRQDDRLSVGTRDGLAQPEDRRAFVDQPDVSGQAESPQRASIVFPLDDDRRDPVLLDQVFDDLLEI